MVPQELSTFAKDNNISLVTHSDPEVSGALEASRGTLMKGMGGLVDLHFLLLEGLFFRSISLEG